MKREEIVQMLIDKCSDSGVSLEMVDNELRLTGGRKVSEDEYDSIVMKMHEAFEDVKRVHMKKFKDSNNVVKQTH